MERAEQSEGFNFRKREDEPTSITGLPIQTSAPKFFNSGENAQVNFAPVQKTKQELMLEEAEKKEQELLIKQKNSTWIGSKKVEGETEAPKPFKANPWAVAASKGEAPTGLKFAPLQPQKTEVRTGGGRQEQEMVFVSKKEQEERRKKREERELLEKVPPKAF